MMKNMLELGTSIVPVCHTVSENPLIMKKKAKYKSGNLNMEERNSNASSQLKQGRRHILLSLRQSFSFWKAEVIKSNYRMLSQISYSHFEPMVAQIV